MGLPVFRFVEQANHVVEVPRLDDWAVAREKNLPETPQRSDHNSPSGPPDQPRNMCTNEAEHRRDRDMIQADS